jgi:predicted alpha/beta hydrolase
VADYRGPVLSVALERDRYSAETGLVRALAPFVNARVDRTRLGSLAQGEAFLGHFDWARRPDGVAGAIERWVSDSVLAS